MVLRDRGDAERARTLQSRLSYVVFGVFVRNCTETPGGGPILHVEDALSSIVPSAAGGELTVTDCSGEFSEGEDIFAAQTHYKTTPS